MYLSNIACLVLGPDYSLKKKNTEVLNRKNQIS